MFVVHKSEIEGVTQMKKVNVKKLFIELGCVAAVGLVISVILTFVFFGFDTPRHFLNGLSGIGLMTEFFIVLGWFMFFEDPFLTRKAYKTLNRDITNAGLYHYSEFESKNSIICIDEAQGKIAVVFKRNYDELQVVDAKDVTNIKADYVRGPLGGATATYFRFIYNNTNVRAYTFWSNQVYRLKSSEIMEGISKADAYCDILKRAQGVM